jgi:hypothetical protein
MRNICAALAGLGLVALATLSVAAVAAPATPRPAAQDKFKYASMVGCNTKDCHGAEAAKGSPALNEYTLWKANDPHSKAFTTLYKAPSKAVGAAMNIANVSTSAKCLGCHSKVVDAANVVEGAKWSVQNGVSCEVCHGPGEKWVKPHATPKESSWDHKKSVENGMADLREPYDWAVKCASCHLAIDHDMIKAGHPRLHFELVDYNARTGAHWKTEKHPSMAAGFDAKTWTVGQAVSLAEALRNLGRHLSGGAAEDLVKKAREQAAAYMGLLKLVPGFTGAEIPADAAKCDELAKAVDAQAKTLAPATEALLGKLAGEEAPKDFSAARQRSLAFKALSGKEKAAVDALCASIAAKNETTFDAGKFAAEYDGVKAKFK